MIQITDPRMCCGCQACVNACPSRCIHMVADHEGFLYPQVDQTLCVGCGICRQVCPMLRQAGPADSRFPPLAFGAVNRDDTIRASSSSGGVFTALALEVLGQGGAVFGAAWDGALHVRHVCARLPEELAALRGSKYVQSAVGNTYTQARELLEGGRPVLFTGTPCQIAGLRAFLNKEYDRLTCVDLICHGVPSPKTWDRYLEELARAQGSPVEQVNFRHKGMGWKNYRLELGFPCGERVYRSHEKDPFFRLFLHDVCLRPSCYQCPFRGAGRAADLTIADFWGVEQVAPELDDDLGTSLVLVHTKRGKELWERAAPNLNWKAVETNRALEGNPCALYSPVMPKERKPYFSHIDRLTTAQAARRAAMPSFPRRLWRRMSDAWRKIK